MQTSAETKKKTGARYGGRLKRALDDAAAREIRAALVETNGNVTHTARLLGISQPGLWRRMKNLKIFADRFRH